MDDSRLPLPEIPLQRAYARGKADGQRKENERCIASVLRHAANSKIFNEVKQVEDWLRHVADDLRSTCPVKLEDAPEG
jgi:hypothetical protein